MELILGTVNVVKRPRSQTLGENYYSAKWLIVTKQLLWLWCISIQISASPNPQKQLLAVDGSNMETLNQPMWEKKDFGGSVLSGTYILHTSLQDPVIYVKRGLVRARGGEWLQGNSVFLTQQGSCRYKSTAIVTACKKPHYKLFIYHIQLIICFKILSWVPRV